MSASRPRKTEGDDYGENDRGPDHLVAGQLHQYALVRSIPE